AETAVRLAAPSAADGGATVEVGTRLWGLDVNALYRVGEDKTWSADLLAGLRTLELSESLVFRTTTTVYTPGLFAGQRTPAGSRFDGVDSFSTRNQFAGAQFGARVCVDCGHGGYLQTRAQLALGPTRQRINIDGETVLIVPGQTPRTAPGNIFTQ